MKTWKFASKSIEKIEQVALLFSLSHKREEIDRIPPKAGGSGYTHRP